jgi:hypothetical protein
MKRRIQQNRLVWGSFLTINRKEDKMLEGPKGDWRKIWLSNKPYDVFRNVIISLNLSKRCAFLRRLFNTDVRSPTLAPASSKAARQANHRLKSLDVTLFTGDKLRTAKILCTMLKDTPSSNTNPQFFLLEIKPYFLPSVHIPRDKYCDTLDVRHQIRARSLAYYRLLKWSNFQNQLYMYP